MKKVVAGIMVSVLCVMLAGCMGAPAALSSSSGSSAASASIASESAASREGAQAQDQVPADQPSTPSVNSNASVPSQSNSGTQAPAISEAEALSSALAHAGLQSDQVDRSSVHFEYEDGVPVYDIEVIVGQMEYDFEIDATTSAILEFEKEPIHN